MGNIVDKFLELADIPEEYLDQNAIEEARNYVSTRQYDKPELGVLVKLGSIAIHVDEMLSSDGHLFDKVALQQLLNDSEVKDWLRAMDKMGLVPKKRN